MRGFAILALAAALAVGQSFEVASIRPHETPLHSIMGWSNSGLRLTLEAWQSHGLIHEAYNLDFFRIVVPPALRDETYYDILAQAPGGAPTRDEFRSMLRALLADRFHFESHREQREMSVYALIVGKSGSKFKPSPAGAIWRVHVGVNGRNQVITASRYTMAALARGLREALGVDRPVVDQTGLTGEYDLRLEATPGFRADRDPQFGDISVFTAVQEQLGLKLEPRKAPIEVLVVDRLDRPSAN